MGGNYLINEMIEVNSYLNRKVDTKKLQQNLYRVCFLLAKWYKEQGLTPVEIREKIFLWAKEKNIYIKHNVNDIIKRALEDKTRLKDNVVVKISEGDLAEINRRFDNKKTKFVALAILAYAKVYADRDREFNLSSVEFGNWVGIHHSNLRRRYLTELIDFGYISKLVAPKSSFKWDGDTANKYKIHVPIHNDGKYILDNNDIRGLYYKIFSSCI